MTKFSIGTESISLLGKGDLIIKLRKHSKKLLKALNAEHVVYGVNRDALGHLRTFFIPMTDKELSIHEAKTTGYVHAVHA